MRLAKENNLFAVAATSTGDAHSDGKAMADGRGK